MFPHVVGLFFKQHSQLHTFTVPRSQALQQWVALIHLSINPKKMQRTGFAMWHDVNQLKWGLFISSTDNCLKTTIFNIKLPLFRQVHGLTVMKRVQKQRHLITIISFLLLARSAMLVPLLKWQPPLKQLSWGVPSCPDRGIFSSICPPRISMSHLSIVPFIRPQQGLSPARTLIQLLNVLMTLWPPTGRGHKFNLTWCKDSCLPVTDWQGQTPQTDSICIQVITCLSSTSADWSSNPAFVQTGHMCHRGSLECPYSHVRWRKSLRIKKQKNKKTNEELTVRK